MPNFLKGGLYRFRLQFQIYKEFAVRPVLAVIRLFGGHAQNFFDQWDVGLEEKGSVEDQKLSFATLGVAGEFQVLDGQIGVALDFDARLKQWFQCGLITLEDISVGSCDGLQRA